MIEALILAGVLAGNADRRAGIDSLDDDGERWRDWVLLGFIILAVFLWPLYGLVYAIRLGIWYVGLIPLAIGASLFFLGLPWVFGIIGLLWAMFEYSRFQAMS